MLAEAELAQLKPSRSRPFLVTPRSVQNGDAKRPRKRLRVERDKCRANVMTAQPRAPERAKSRPSGRPDWSCSSVDRGIDSFLARSCSSRSAYPARPRASKRRRHRATQSKHHNLRSAEKYCAVAPPRLDPCLPRWASKAGLIVAGQWSQGRPPKLPCLLAVSTMKRAFAMVAVIFWPLRTIPLHPRAIDRDPHRHRRQRDWAENRQTRLQSPATYCG